MMRYAILLRIGALLLACAVVAACGRQPPAQPEPKHPAKVISRADKVPGPSRTPEGARERPAAEPKGTLAAVMDRGELRVGMQMGYVPFEMAGPDGQPCGLDVDSAAMVAASLGVGLRLVRQNWEGLVPPLLEGKIDLIMSGMTITPQRNVQVAFTDPVLETGRMFLVHKTNRDRFKKFKDLDSDGIFVVAGRTGLGELRVKELLPRVGFREFPESSQALEEVLQGRAHAFVDEEFTVRLACARHAGKLLSGFEPLTYEPVAWAIRPGDSHWLNWLNHFIRRIRKDGSLERLKIKWLRDYFLDLKAHPK
ncbi:MAG: transporter substrate-binding domain-containing protein [Thermodesulfobacteriota bacterium]